MRDLVSPMWRTTWDAHGMVGMVGNLMDVSTGCVYGPRFFEGVFAPSPGFRGLVHRPSWTSWAVCRILPLFEDVQGASRGSRKASSSLEPSAALSLRPTGRRSDAHRLRSGRVPRLVSDPLPLLVSRLSRDLPNLLQPLFRSETLDPLLGVRDAVAVEIAPLPPPARPHRLLGPFL